VVARRKRTPTTGAQRRSSDLAVGLVVRGIRIPVPQLVAKPALDLAVALRILEPDDVAGEDGGREEEEDADDGRPAEVERERESLGGLDILQWASSSVG
jgi:hypothetical protein